MTQIQRFNGNVRPFADDAINTERTVFGDNAQDDAIDANINADFFRGWGVVPVNGLPTKQDFNGSMYGSTALTAHLYQMGIAPWHVGQEYFTHAITNRNGVLYTAVQSNVGQDPATDTNETNWTLSAGGSNGNPIGTSILWNTTTPPENHLEEDGAEYSRTVYADLFAIIGTTFGAGDGSTTFNVDDTRGEFIRGWDNGRGIDAGRVLGSHQLDEFKSHTHGHKQAPIDTGGGGIVNGAYSSDFDVSQSQILFEGGEETRPRNTAKMTCIKYA